MALSSARFSGNTRLSTVVANNPAMNWGEVGQPVRLVQQALADLGFSLPISFQRFRSPDGIFGDETKAAVSAFQRRHGLTADGVVGRNTLTKLDQLVPRGASSMPAIDPMSMIRFKFTMTFRSGAMPVIPESTALANARKVYGQYGIRVDEGAGMSILITPDQQVILDASQTQCTLNQEDGLQQLLFSLGGGRSGVGPNEILVFYVNNLTDTNNKLLNGCASHKPGNPAVAVAAGGSPWSCAHEVGHVLLGNMTPTHSESQTNLMFRSTNALTAAIPGLSEVQVRQMIKSPSISRL